MLDVTRKAKQAELWVNNNLVDQTTQSRIVSISVTSWATQSLVWNTLSNVSATTTCMVVLLPSQRLVATWHVLATAHKCVELATFFLYTQVVQLPFINHQYHKTPPFQAIGNIKDATPIQTRTIKVITFHGKL